MTSRSPKGVWSAHTNIKSFTNGKWDVEGSITKVIIAAITTDNLTVLSHAGLKANGVVHWPSIHWTSCVSRCWLHYWYNYTHCTTLFWLLPINCICIVERYCNSSLVTRPSWYLHPSSKTFSSKIGCKIFTQQYTSPLIFWLCLCWWYLYYVVDSCENLRPTSVQRTVIWSRSSEVLGRRHPGSTWTLTGGAGAAKLVCA